MHCQKPFIGNQAILADGDNVKARGRLHQKKGGHRGTAAELFDHGGKRNIAQTVTIVGQKHLFALEMRLHRLEPFANIGIYPGLNERDGPVINVAIQEIDLLAAL